MQPSSEQALLEATKELVAIKSTGDSPAELRRAYEYMWNFVSRNTPDVTIEEFEKNGKPSFLAYQGESRPERFHVMFNAHVDVVPGKPKQYDMTVNDGKIHGRGVYDMKAAAIIMAQVFCEIVGSADYPLGLQIVTDEEPGGLNGTLHQVQQGVLADFIICGECGRSLNAYEIANEHKGIVFADIELNGKSSHGAYPWNGDNAAMRAVQFIKNLHDIYPDPKSESPDTTATITSISSTADSHNKTPEQAIIKIDCRFTADDPNFLHEGAFAKFITSLDPRAKIARLHIFSRPMYSSPDYAPLQRLKIAAERVEGHEFSLVRRHAGSDGRHFQQSGGQACEFGIAGESQHGDDEYITVKSFNNYLHTLRAFLEATHSSEATKPDHEMLHV